MKFSFDDKQIKRIKGHASEITKRLDMKVKFEGNELIIDGKPFEEWIGKDVITALSLGFESFESFGLIDETKLFKMVNLEDYVESKSLKRIKSRIIGKNGKAKKNIEEMTEVKICIYENTIGVIGDIENVNLAFDAIMKIVSGSTHSAVYQSIQRRIRSMKEKV
jgi:ribosomal RNA assembly protein